MVETKTLEEFLEEEHFNTTQQNEIMTQVFGYHDIPNVEDRDGLIDKFPSFWFGDEDEHNIDLNFRYLFLNRYDIRRIGQEENALFLHYLREKTQELLIKYAPKIRQWQKNFNDLFKFTVKLERDDTDDYTIDNKNTYYLNPANAATTNLKVQDVDQSHKTNGRIFHSERDVLQSVWGKTRADIMEKILELKDIYNECLNSYEVIFSGVL